MKTTRLALLALLAAALLLTGCGKDDKPRAAATTSTTREATSSSSTSSTAPARTVVDAVGTAKRWLAAVASGDDGTALQLLSPRSLAKIGGADGWKKMKIELAEGWGAWGRADGVELKAQPVPFPKDVAIVILHGEVSQEGPPQESWNALPVVATDEGDRVEAFLDIGTVSVDPKEGSDIAEGDEVKITSSTSDDLYVLVDDQPAEMPQLRDVDGSGAHWRLMVPALDPGLHSITAVVSGDGIQATHFEYTVRS